MTLEKTKELLSVQAGLGGGYNRNAAELFLAKVRNDQAKRRSIG